MVPESYNICWLLPVSKATQPSYGSADKTTWVRQPLSMHLCSAQRQTHSDSLPSVTNAAGQRCKSTLHCKLQDLPLLAFDMCSTRSKQGCKNRLHLWSCAMMARHKTGHRVPCFACCCANSRWKHLQPETQLSQQHGSPRLGLGEQPAITTHALNPAPTGAELPAKRPNKTERTHPHTHVSPSYSVNNIEKHAHASLHAQAAAAYSTHPMRIISSTCADTGRSTPAAGPPHSIPKIHSATQHTPYQPQRQCIAASTSTPQPQHPMHWSLRTVTDADAAGGYSWC